MWSKCKAHCFQAFQFSAHCFTNFLYWSAGSVETCYWFVLYPHVKKRASKHGTRGNSMNKWNNLKRILKNSNPSPQESQPKKPFSKMIEPFDLRSPHSESLKNLWEFQTKSISFLKSQSQRSFDIWKLLAESQRIPKHVCTLCCKKKYSKNLWNVNEFQNITKNPTRI